MAGEIFEWYGYATSDPSPAAALAASDQTCPFVLGKCSKPGGVCSIKMSSSAEVVPVCPKRMYFDSHQMLARIAEHAFALDGVPRDSEGKPELVSGKLVAEVAKVAGHPQVGVFGGSFASEISLPPAIDGGAKYKVDFTMVLVDELGKLREFVAIEVQSIDTTNSYGSGLVALQRSREIVSTGVGLNWENVNKRILPQLIMKGLVLQGEERCTKGMFFVTPESVYQKIMKRLGGDGRLRRIPMQPSSITFVRLSHDFESSAPGEPLRMKFLPEQTVSISDMSLAFISPENLPPAGAYGRSIQLKL